MKNIILLFVVLGITCSCAVQKTPSDKKLSAEKTLKGDTSIAISFLKHQEIYRGVDNQVTINVSPKTLDYKVTCTNCDTLYKSDLPHTYIIRPSKTNTQYFP